MERKLGHGVGDGVSGEVRDALNQMFFAVLRVNPAKDTALILQSRDRPENEWKEMSWSGHLAQYAAFLTEQGAARLQERLSSKALLAEIESGKHTFTVDLSYEKGHQTN